MRVRASGVCDSSAVPPVAAGVDFLDEPLAAFGVLLVGGALVSGLARRSFLSLTAAFVVAGFLLGQDGLEVLDLDPRSEFVQGLAVIGLILLLFRDGLEVEEEMLQRAWHLPLRNLVLAMPLTAILVALLTRAVTDLVNLYYFIWKEAGGDVRSAALMREGNLQLNGSH